MKKLVLIVLVSITLLQALQTRVFAEEFSLSVYPPVLEIQAKSPAQIQSRITIENTGSRAVDLEILLKPFIDAGTSQGTVSYSSDLSDIYKILFDQVIVSDGTNPLTTLRLEQDQKKDLYLMIPIDQTISEGDYYFSIIFLNSKIQNDQQVNIQMPSGISTNVLLSIGDKTANKIEAKEFSAPSFVTSGPVPFSVLAQNSGKRFVTASGTILIKNMFGSVVGKVDLLPDHILAHSTRYLASSKSFDDTFKVIKSKPQIAAVWNENFLLGFYTATLTLKTDNTSPEVTYYTTFTALPINILLAVIIMIAIPLSIMLRVKRKI